MSSFLATGHPKMEIYRYLWRKRSEVWFIEFYGFRLILLILGPFCGFLVIFSENINFMQFLWLFRRKHDFIDIYRKLSKFDVFLSFLRFFVVFSIKLDFRTKLWIKWPRKASSDQLGWVISLFYWKNAKKVEKIDKFVFFSKKWLKIDKNR